MMECNHCKQLPQGDGGKSATFERAGIRGFVVSAGHV
jgi:hypothetical protein